MLKELRIRNFKGWQDTGLIRMAPITLLFGANSSGKSSIGQFLLMLKQTVESPDRRTVFYPGGRTSPVQLGSYREMVFQRNPDNKISFQYRWALPEKLEVKDPVSQKTYFGDELSFQAKVGLDDGFRHTPTLDHLKYELRKKGATSESLSVGLNYEPEGELRCEVATTGYSLKTKQDRLLQPAAPVRFYGFPDEVVACYQNADFVQDLNLQHEIFFGRLRYLGPLRTRAERLYSWTGSEPESVGFTGENTIAAILGARNRKISLGDGRPAEPFEQVIATQLKRMGLIEDFDVSRIAEQRQEYEVRVQTKGASYWVDLPDVGFGVSQVLPVLVECFYAPKDSIILMEQPEVHLHPSAQSALADIMIDVMQSQENGEKRNIQLIIETHSEHFLRRLQRRIAEEKLQQEEVSVYFANLAQVPATLEPLKLDPYGNILNWPENFFGDEMLDITEQARFAMKRRIELAREKEEKPE